VRLRNWVSLEAMLDGDEERCSVEDDGTQELASLVHGLKVMQVSQCISILSLRIDIFFGQVNASGFVPNQWTW